MARPLALMSLAMVLALPACARKDAAPPPAPVAAAGEERMTVRSRDVADLKTVTATVTTRNIAEARARIGGTLVRLTVKEGDPVRAGQAIALVADERLSRQTESYDAQAAAAAAEATRAQADLTRVRSLYEKGFYAKAGLDQVQAQADAAQANLKAAHAQRAASAELSSQGAILAPSTGRILKASVPTGSVVAAGQAVATVTAGDLLLRVEIPEAQGRELRAGQPIAIDSADLPGAGAGVVAQVYPAVTAGRIVADISAPGLRSEFIGQRVRLRLPVGQRSALVVPRRYVATRFGIDFARIVDRGGRVMEVAVQTTAGPGADSLEVLSGLSEGDVILAAGAGR